MSEKGSRADLELVQMGCLTGEPQRWPVHLYRAEITSATTPCFVVVVVFVVKSGL